MFVLRLSSCKYVSMLLLNSLRKPDPISVLQGVQPQGSTQVDGSSESMAGADEALAQGDDEVNESRGQSATLSRQTQKLYSAEGILNPKMKRTEKKRRKKGKSSGEAMDKDYFKVDYRKKSMGSDADGEIIGEALMSGVKFDECTKTGLAVSCLSSLPFSWLQIGGWLPILLLKQPILQYMYCQPSFFHYSKDKSCIIYLVGKVLLRPLVIFQL